MGLYSWKQLFSISANKVSTNLQRYSIFIIGRHVAIWNFSWPQMELYTDFSKQPREA